VACGQDFHLFFRQTQIGCRMLWSTKTSISCNNLSAMSTHEHANSVSSPTYLQLISRGGKLGEHGK
jgi:hypothetical protein